MQKKQKQLENKDDESLLSHLEALRTTVIHCLVSMCVVLPFALYLSPKLLIFLTKILSEKNNITLNYFSPMEVFIIQLKLALLISLIVASPYIAKKIWDFLLPALYDNEKKFIKRVVILSILFDSIKHTKKGFIELGVNTIVKYGVCRLHCPDFH